MSYFWIIGMLCIFVYPCNGRMDAVLEERDDAPPHQPHSQCTYTHTHVVSPPNASPTTYTHYLTHACHGNGPLCVVTCTDFMSRSSSASQASAAASSSSSQASVAAAAVSSSASSASYNFEQSKKMYKTLTAISDMIDDECLKTSTSTVYLNIRSCPAPLARRSAELRSSEMLIEASSTIKMLDHSKMVVTVVPYPSFD